MDQKKLSQLQTKFDANEETEDFRKEFKGDSYIIELFRNVTYRAPVKIRGKYRQGPEVIK